MKIHANNKPISASNVYESPKSRALWTIGVEEHKGYVRFQTGCTDTGVSSMHSENMDYINLILVIYEPIAIDFLRVESYIIFTLHAGNVRLRCREIVKTHRKRVNNLNHAVHCIMASWHQRLCACVRAGDRHFEHTM